MAVRTEEEPHSRLPTDLLRGGEGSFFTKNLKHRNTSTIENHNGHKNGNGSSSHNGKIEISPNGKNGNSEILIENNFQIYLSQLKDFPLLTAEEENFHILRMNEGEKVREEVKQKRSPKPNKGEQKAIEEGEESRQILIISNTRLVVSIAKKYQKRAPLEDLIQEGNMGLMRAIEKFDTKKGKKLSTYATPWIKAKIERYIDQKETRLRIPNHTLTKIKKYLKVKEDLEKTFGREAKRKEIAETMGVETKAIHDFEILSFIPYSLEMEIDTEEGESLALIDTLHDKEFAVEEEVEKRISEKRINGHLKELTIREKQVVKLRNGFNNNDEHTLGGTAKKIDVTFQRVQQLEKSALQKLKILENGKTS